MRFAVTVAALVLLTISGCGFHLRGNMDIPMRYQQLRLNANPNSDFTKALIDQLQANDIRIVEQAPINVTITDDDVEVRTVSYSSRSKSAEKEIVRRVEFLVEDRQNKELIVPRSEIQARRAYLYDDTKVAAMQEQEALIREELAFDLATRLMLKLQKH
ncbi:MAG: LPS assembly lipoprotein LptE [Ketobacteraceae bacterium]|nr:LPS assembly lipoprotein LptE [Ketobacteraceae bacterium]